MRFAIATVLLLITCTPPVPQPTPEAAPFPVNQTAAAVLTELVGCFDGGLPELEQLHANVNRPPWVDCVFTIGSTVQSCEVPCPESSSR
jgi:hypothetical protein